MRIHLLSVIGHRSGFTKSMASRLGLFSLVAGVACGCTVLSYTGPNGERFSRTSFGTTTAIAALTVESGTNGLRRVELQGYQNESAQALSAITEAAIRAALQGAN